MQRYIVSEQIIGIMLSKCLVDGKDGLKLADLNVKVRSISNQIQQECKAIIDFAGKDIYKFIYDYEKYFNLEAYAHELEEKGRYALCNNGMFKL